MSHSRFSLIFPLLAKLGVLTLILGSFNIFTPQTFAQIRGEDSQEFFDEGDQEMEQEVQELENKPTSKPPLQQEEQNLEQDLNIQEKDPNAVQKEEIPSPSLGDGDNVSTPPPLGETEFKFPLK
jgi:hypothetical protein